MVGVKIGQKWLVERAFKDDGWGMGVYIVCLILSVVAGKVGKIILLAWLIFWIVIQLLCHEWYLFSDNGPMGDAKGKIEYFKNTIKLVESKDKYILDLYHIVLHVLLVIAIVDVVHSML